MDKLATKPAVRLRAEEHPENRPPSLQEISDGNFQTRPIGFARALIGKGKGDTVEVTTPGGARSYEILKVEFI